MIKIRARILLPLALALFLILVGYTATLFSSKERFLQQHLDALAMNVQSRFSADIVHNAEKLGIGLSALKQNEALKRLFVARNRQQLLDDSEQLFLMLRANYEITHLYFDDLNRINFLRVHQPQDY